MKDQIGSSQTSPVGHGDPCPMPPEGSRVIDFRHGGWGHAMHGFTWRVLEPRIVKRGRFRKRQEIPQVSVMVHSMTWPEEGDQVLYTGESREDRIATIAVVKPCWDPRDMHTLILEDIRAYSRTQSLGDGAQDASTKANSGMNQ